MRPFRAAARRAGTGPRGGRTTLRVCARFSSAVLEMRRFASWQDCRCLPILSSGWNKERRFLLTLGRNGLRNRGFE